MGNGLLNVMTRGFATLTTRASSKSKTACVSSNHDVG
jgi:hypothetical protein